MSDLLLPASVFEGLLTDDFADFEGGNAAYPNPGEVTIVKANEWFIAREEIQMGETFRTFNVRTMLVEPILSSVAMRKTNATSRPDRIDFNATVVTSRRLDVEVKAANGPVWVEWSDFIYAAIKAANPSFPKSKDDFLLDLKGYGYDPMGRLPMFLQHLGASEEHFAAITADFVNRGAQDNTGQVSSRAQGQRSRVERSYRHPEGIPIAHLEISKANRSLSQNGTGFIGFADAAWGTFAQVLAQDRKRTALRRGLSIARESGDADTERRLADAEADMRTLFSNARTLRAFRNWGGTTVVPDPLDDTGNRVTYYAQQVPCGRFAVGEGNDVTTYSVWGQREGNNNSAQSGSPASEATATAVAAVQHMLDEEPF